MSGKGASLPAGMGAIPHAEGVAFRVWAPHANEVYVAGSFNDWSETAGPLSSEGNGFWAADVSAAKAGDEYKYLIVNGKQRLLRLDPYSREVTNSVGNSIVSDPDFDWGEDRYEMPNWNELIVYELHVGTFNPKSKDVPGTFDGVSEKLPYLRDLGINAIEIMPPMEFPGSYSWGYNPSQPFAVESSYGGVKKFKELVKAAHAHGIAVILDVVYNHFGPTDLDLWRFDGWSENDKGGIYFYNDGRAATPWGDTRPDYGRGEVREYLRDNALMWLDEYRVDGLRWDATAYIRNIRGEEASPANDLPDGWSVMQWINEEIQARWPGKLTIAEDLKDNEWLTRSTGEGGAGFGSQWDGAFVHPHSPGRHHERRLHARHGGRRRGHPRIASPAMPSNASSTPNRTTRLPMARARVPEEIWPGKVNNWFSKKRSTLGAALVLDLAGHPDALSGPGVHRRQVVSGQGSPGMGQSREVRRHRRPPPDAESPSPQSGPAQRRDCPARTSTSFTSTTSRK